jgi:hypothetical protein
MIELPSHEPLVAFEELSEHRVRVTLGRRLVGGPRRRVEGRASHAGGQCGNLDELASRDACWKMHDLLLSHEM